MPLTIRVFVVLVLLLVSVPARASDCAYRLISNFAFAVTDIQHQREKIRPEVTPEMLIATPLRLQRTTEESALEFTREFNDCQFSLPEVTSFVATTFTEIAERYKEVVDFGRRAWAALSVTPTSDQELREATIAVQKLRAEMAEQEVKVERTDATLLKAAQAVLYAVLGRHPTDPNRMAVMLTQAEKQKLITSIAETCHNECKVAAGVKYTYGSVGLILEKLREPFALDGLPMEPRDRTKPR